MDGYRSALDVILIASLIAIFAVLGWMILAFMSGREVKDTSQMSMSSEGSFSTTDSFRRFQDMIAQEDLESSNETRWTSSEDNSKLYRFGPTHL